MTFSTFLFFVLGLILLVAGADIFVRGASRLAAAIGVSPLVIGLTVVAYGTSAPELAVSIQSTLTGYGDISLGNVIGSNIANVLLILGLASLAAPLIVDQQLVRLDVPIMIGISIIVYLFSLSGTIQPWQGVLLAFGAVAYTVFLIRQSRKETKAIQAQYAEEFDETPPTTAAQWLLTVGYVVIGGLMLVLGANWLVESAITFAQYFGISEVIIGLTVVAVGTSLPEVATSVVASLRGERDIAVGNVVGSNIFNLLLVLGAASAISPNGMSVPAQTLAIDLPIMVAVALLCLPIFVRGEIPRWVGGLFLAYYVAYNLYLYLNAAQSGSLDTFIFIMLQLLMPLTVVVVVIAALRTWLAERR
ncbi:MAG: calcium/sodium antiporter [Chloroflexi bacterium]|nr:calcium/sodium antiporter [Chloroflexota bacterium]